MKTQAGDAIPDRRGALATRCTSSAPTGFIGSGFSGERRYRARRIPPVRFIAKPRGNFDGGYTSTSLAVKSVSTAVDEAKTLTAIGPTTSTFSVSGSVWKTRMVSDRAASGR